MKLSQISLAILLSMGLSACKLEINQEGEFDDEVVETPTDSLPTGDLAFTGNFEQNSDVMLVTDALADIDGDIILDSFTWYADDVEIIGATSDTLNLTQNEVGKKISAEVVFHDDMFNLQYSLQVESSSLVQNIDDALAGSVMISGNFTEGETLQASNDFSDLDGLGTVSYQWFVADAAVATGASYTLQIGDSSKEVYVAATHTDSLGGVETVSSSKTLIAAADTGSDSNVAMIEITDGDTVIDTAINIPTCSVAAVGVQAKNSANENLDATGSYSWSSADDTAVAIQQASGTDAILAAGPVEASNVSVTVELDNPVENDAVDVNVVDNFFCTGTDSAALTYNFANTFAGAGKPIPTEVIDGVTVVAHGGTENYWYSLAEAGNGTLAVPTTRDVLIGQGFGGGNALHLATPVGDGSTLYAEQNRRTSAIENPFHFLGSGQNQGDTFELTVWAKNNTDHEVILSVGAQPWFNQHQDGTTNVVGADIDGNSWTPMAKANVLAKTLISGTVPVGAGWHKVSLGMIRVPVVGEELATGSAANDGDKPWVSGWSETVYFSFELTPADGVSDDIVISDISLVKTIDVADPQP